MWVVLDEWLVSDRRVPLLDRGAVFSAALELRRPRLRDVRIAGDGRHPRSALKQTPIPDAPVGCVATTVSGEHDAGELAFVRWDGIEILLAEPLQLVKARFALVGELGIAVFSGVRQRREWVVNRIMRQASVHAGRTSASRESLDRLTAPPASPKDRSGLRLVSRADYLAEKEGARVEFVAIDWKTADTREVDRIELPTAGSQPGETRYLLNLEAA